MAQAKNGINGGFSGKAGSVIGYTVRGKQVMRSVPRKITKNPSEKQLAARARFGLLQQWRSPLTSFFAITFKNHTHERSAQNAAHHFNSGIVKGEYPNYVIDYSSIVISSGNLPFLTNLQLDASDKQNVNLAWEASYESDAAANDLVAYLILYDQHDYFDGNLNAVERGAGNCKLTLNYPEGCKTAHIYVTVLSNDRERAANSAYLGKIELP
ncbi:MAG: DUF6266 family protein [Pedobacter sp.]|jgi:hypothetical protein|uniref:DUF6266 family protein n=1 Tax=Pedobacter sp. TaxID=1411316 RepID=UPI00356A9200